MYDAGWDGVVTSLALSFVFWAFFVGVSLDSGLGSCATLIEDVIPVGTSKGVVA